MKPYYSYNNPEDVYDTDFIHGMGESSTQRDVVEVNNGVPFFSTTANARTAEEEVPVNPLPDQVNPDGSDPEETDSDLDDDEYQAPKTAKRRKISAFREQGVHAPTRKASATTPPKLQGQISSKNEALASAISVKARLPPCQIGAVEMLTFFPHHTQWPEAGLRKYQNGWKHKDIARIQLHARGNLTEENETKRVNSLKHQLTRNGNEFFGIQDFTARTHVHLMTPVPSSDASNYAPRDTISQSQLFDASLCEVAEGVSNWPTGQDRGIVTQCIEYAYQNDLRQYTAADIPQLAAQMGFLAPSEASGSRWDENAKQRVNAIVGLDS